MASTFVLRPTAMRLRPWAARRSARQATLHRLLPAEFFSTAVHQQPQRQQQLQLPRRRRRCHRHSQSGAFVHMFSTSRDEGISATSNSNSSTSSTSSANPEPGIPHGPPPSPAMDRDFNAPFGHSAQGNSRQSNHSESYNNARWSTNHAGYKVPDPSECVAMPRKYRSASNDVLSVLAAQGLAGARKERLLREIMAKDGITWPEAREKLYEINLFNDRFGRIFQMPFRIGIMLGVSFGFGCIPLVFHKDTAVWFNQTFVHEELPDDLSNFWQVGEWTWGWMEPALGTLSFTLLSMQLTRQYMLRMQWAPYTDHINNYRADRLALRFPQYEREIIRDFAKSDSWVDTARAEHRKIVDEEIRMGKQEDENAQNAMKQALAQASQERHRSPRR